jgi:hypothetical protein
MAEAAFEPVVGFMGPQIFGLPVDREILFSNHKNSYKKRIEKRQRKLIVKMSFLKSFLKNGEQILLISTGYAPLAGPAQYLTGFVFVYLKRSIFVFTNYRILHIPTTSAYNYKNSIAQVVYAGCQSVRLKGGTLVVQYAGAGRKTEKFRAIAVSERKKIRALLKKKIPLSGTKVQFADRIHLCPRCTHKLEKGKHQCAKCQLRFKSKLVAAISSILLPGGGYFYIRQYLIGVLDALVEIGLLGFIVFLVLDFLKQIPISPSHLALIPIFLYVKTAAVIHVSHFIAEFIPKNTDIKPVKTSG